MRLQSNVAHFLQSAAWEQFQNALGRKTFTARGNGWRYLAILETGRFNTRLYCPYGPEVESPAALDEALTSLRKLAATQRAVFIRIEPTGHIQVSDLPSRGLLPLTYSHMQPERTQLIDLSPSEDELIAAMSQPARNLYRNFHKKGLTLKLSQNPADIEQFLRLIHGVAERTGITPHSDDYFRTQAQSLFPTGAAQLYTMSLDTAVVAAVVLFDDEHTRYYAHAAADDAYRKLGAGTALLAHAIIDAKRLGKQTFDLYGIAPADQPHHRWAGFTRFKQQFGGEPFDYVGAWELPVRPIAYRLYRMLQTLRTRR